MITYSIKTRVHQRFLLTRRRRKRQASCYLSWVERKDFVPLLFIQWMAWPAKKQEQQRSGWIQLWPWSPGSAHTLRLCSTYVDVKMWMNFAIVQSKNSPMIRESRDQTGGQGPDSHPPIHYSSTVGLCSLQYRQCKIRERWECPRP